ncbi:MAG: hypothetical protein IT384_29085 [Deltaproteobacteria bacterium]|nr:hypothetical protein [Deltaproteobacteria bacterium]
MKRSKDPIEAALGELLAELREPQKALAAKIETAGPRRGPAWRSSVTAIAQEVASLPEDGGRASSKAMSTVAGRLRDQLDGLRRKVRGLDDAAAYADLLQGLAEANLSLPRAATLLSHMALGAIPAELAMILSQSRVTDERTDQWSDRRPLREVVARAATGGVIERDAYRAMALRMKAYLTTRNISL